MGPLKTGERNPHPDTSLLAPRRARRYLMAVMAVAGAPLLLATMAVPAAADPTGAPGDSAHEIDAPSVVEIHLAGREDLDRLVALGADIGSVDPAGEGMVAHTVVTPEERAELSDMGFRFGDVVYTQDDWAERIAEREATIEANEAENDALRDEVSTLSGADTVRILRADYFESREGEFLSVEVKSSDGQDEDFELTVHRDSGPGTGIGSGGAQTLTRFVDAGVYLYHRGLDEVTERPAYIEVTSPNGGSDVAEVTEWLPEEEPDKPLPFTDFVNQYLTPTEINERIHQLQEEFPHLAEVVELPNRTNGYRRVAQTVFGAEAASGEPAPVASRVVVNSLAWGHEGGNDISVELADPGASDRPLSVEVDGDAVEVSLATDGDGAVRSTAAQVVEALNGEAGSLVRAHTFRGDAGDGIVAPAPATRLSDFLDAPGSVSRDPHPVYLLRIGRHRDGSKMGVLAYSQEHAREWQTPLVTLETAERLLRNYPHHRRTRQLLDNLDIFIVPTVNPDGGHYSFYDYALQRKNMTNHCPTDGAADPLARDQWGVDVNRNYGAYTLWDGYFGASPDCTSATFAGPRGEGPLSEPESRNIVWIADEHPNIEFAMNIHSWGDYFMWSPGAYIEDGRVPAPRPDVNEEAFFWGSSASILSAIKQHRGTVVTPGRTGPIIDVLYSAAGNSGDHLWYLNDIYAWNFEVGGAGFQPEWEEAHEQAMEYSNGLYRLFEVAYEFDRDRKRPKSHLVPGAGSYPGPVEVTFEVSEPAAVFYTLDGSRPTFESHQLQSAGVREGAETLLIEETTTINWFSVDQAGNIERNYKPDGNGRNHNSARIIID